MKWLRIASTLALVLCLAGQPRAEEPLLPCGEQCGQPPITYDFDAWAPDGSRRYSAFQIHFDAPHTSYSHYQQGDAELLDNCSPTDIVGYWWSGNDFCYLTGFNITQLTDDGYVSVYGQIYQGEARGWAAFYGVDDVPDGVYYVEGEPGCCLVPEVIEALP